MPDHEDDLFSGTPVAMGWGEPEDSSGPNPYDDKMFVQFMKEYPNSGDDTKAKAAWDKTRSAGHYLEIMETLRLQKDERRRADECGYRLPEWKTAAQYLTAKTWREDIRTTSQLRKLKNAPRGKFNGEK